MTITTTGFRDQYVAAGGETKFTITFDFDLSTDIVVYETLDGADPDEASDLVPASSYVVSGAGFDTPSVQRFITLDSTAYPSGSPASSTWTIIRDMPLTRSTDFKEKGNFSSANLNEEFDRTFAAIQQVEQRLEKLGLTYIENQILDSGGADNTIPKLAAPSGGKLHVWTTNSAGDLIDGELVEDSGYSTLRSELINDESGSDGAKIVGYYNSAESPNQTTVHAAMDALFARPSSSGWSTGDIKLTMKAAPDSGFIMMDDGTLGLTGATYNGTTYQDLYNFLWTNIADAQCPVTPGGRGASAAADWAANKIIRLPLAVGRHMALSGDGGATLASTFTTDFATAPTILTLTSTANFIAGMKVQLTTTGSLPAPLATSTDYYINISSATQLTVSTSPSNYTSATVVTLTSNGSGTHTITPQWSTQVIGGYHGFTDHILSVAELTQHTHDSTIYEPIGTGAYGGGSETSPSANQSLNTTGSSTPFSQSPGSVHYNAMIKL